MAKYKLGDICEIVSGSTPKTGIDEYWDGDIKWITPAELNDDTYIITDSVRKITELAVKKTGLSSFPEGTVILSSRAPIGKVAIAGCEMYCNQGFKNLICSEKINNKYLYWFLKGNTAYLNSLGRGATFKEISKGIVSEIEINVPDIDKQEEAVVTLEKVSEVIALRKKELSTLDDLIKARFVEMMESTELSDETSIENITERVKVGFVGTCEKFYTDELGVPMLRTGNITENGIDLSDLKYVTEEFHEKNKKSQIHEGDLLIARHGSNGQANVYTGPEAQCLNAVVIVPNEDIACSVFLAGLINSPTVKAQIEKTLVGSTQHVVNTKSIASLKVKIPNLTVQKQYCDFVKQVDKSKVVVQKALDETQLLFDSLMQEYFG
ncbi:MAG: restriction endonuclease subunit S [Lachnospiraceae bacterium]|nr:restriction endonuclease subunit S [Lachnospiraceae bacterium]